jgi:pimeloyl-ACP methyl ester carboxylesterase
VQPETRYARSGGVSIAYQVVGDGPFDVVLVQNFSHVELMWSMANHQGEIPRRLSSFARLIAFDRRGVGMSDRVHGASFEERTDDIRAVMDAAGSKRAALFGLFDGAAMSVLFAATYPERTSALVLLSSVPRTLWAPDYPVGLTEEQWNVAKSAILKFYLGSREEAAAIAPGFRGSEPTDEDILEDIDYIRRSFGSARATEEYFEAFGSIDVRRLLPAVQSPTLLMHGTEAAPYSIEMARYAAERIPGARLLELKGEPAIPAGAGLRRALDESEAFLQEAWESGAWEEPEPDRVLATVLFRGVVDSSVRAAELGDRTWRELLGRHHDLVRRQLVRFRGQEVNTMGDGFLASFDGPARAIRCAQAIVGASKNWTSRCEPGCIRASASWWTTRWPGSRFTRGRESLRWRGPAKCSSRAPSRIWSPAPGSPSKIAACASSRASRASGGSTRSSADGMRRAPVSAMHVMMQLV